MSNQIELAANNADLENLLQQALAMPTTEELLDQAKEYVNENAAPVGFGLGIETPALVSNCNNAVSNGWYQVTGAENLPVGYSDGWIFVSSFSDEYKRQDFYSELFNGIHAVRYMNKNIWGEWDWVNPPVGLGREYRTTERIQGKPVYTHLFSVSEPANGSAITLLSYSTGAKIIRYNAYDDNGTPFPYQYSDSSYNVWVRVYRGGSAYAAMIHAGANAALASNIYIQIWYTKD